MPATKSRPATSKGGDARIEHFSTVEATLRSIHPWAEHGDQVDDRHRSRCEHHLVHGQPTNPQKELCANETHPLSNRSTTPTRTPIAEARPASRNLSSSSSSFLRPEFSTSRASRNASQLCFWWRGYNRAGLHTVGKSTPTTWCSSG